MRIALVYRSFRMTGSQARRTVEVARFLSQRHEVHVFSIGARTDASLAPRCTFHDVPVGHVAEGVRFSARELLAFGLRAARIVDRRAFDIVHVCNPGTWIGDVLHLPGVARAEGFMQGYSRLRLIAGSIRTPGNAARGFIERRAIRSPAVRRFHVDAPSVVADLERYHGIASERTLVVAQAVNRDEFRPADDKTAARAAVSTHDPRRTLFLFCGSDLERKGLDRAIEALAASNVDAELLVVGTSEEEGRFRALARQRRIEDRVRFLGTRSDPARFYQAADVLLLPTRADVWGVTPIEAMASGIPSIVSEAAGSSVVVGEADAGIVLREPLDVRGLREAMERLAHDPALRCEMGRNGLAAVDAHSWESRGQLVEDDLIALVEGRTRT
jgi:glycosyltransferase involved in cell wall biosynthesis